MTTASAVAPEVGAVPSLFVVPCPSCREEFEAHAAEWCRCVGKEISPTCPRCALCLCRVAEAARRDFWRQAPGWLRDRRAAETRRRALESAARPANAIDVLIVDDDEEIRMIAAYSIGQMGYRVAVAPNGRKALDILASGAPRIVLTDALMPAMDGRDLCRSVKTANPEVKVVIMTSLYTSPRYKYEAYKTFRADEYLAKPIDFERLRDVLQKLAPVAAGGK